MSHSATSVSLQQAPELQLTWNVPHKNHYFTGREVLLTKLRQNLAADQLNILPQVLYGLGGVGKTQLAIEYAYRHAADYYHVWWVRAEEQTVLADDYAALAGALRLPGKNLADQSAICRAVRHWLGRNPKWLLIFDNARTPEALHDYLPQGATGHVLVTSRNPNWRRDFFNTLPVGVMERSESVAFLCQWTGDKVAAMELAHALGDLPLALVQACAYIQATGGSLFEYLTRFRAYQGDLLKRGAPSLDDLATVTTTWQLSFQEIQQASPVAAELLNLLAFMGSDDIPQEILSRGVRYLPASLATIVRDPLALDDVIIILRRYSLVEVIDTSFSMHRLVQTVVRDRLTEETKKIWASIAVRLVNSMFPFDSDDVLTWPVLRRLLPHALETVKHATQLQVDLNIAGRLSNQVGLYLRERAQFAEAQKCFEQILHIAMTLHGPSHSAVATAVNNLASIRWAVGDLTGAQAYLAQALQITEAVYGPNHPEVAVYRNNLGNVLRELKDLAGAQAYLAQALQITEAVYGPNHPEVAVCLNNLGHVRRDSRDLAGAQACYERALQITKVAYGPRHPHVATCLSSLGGIRRILEDWVGARAYYEQALQIDEAVYGQDHPNVAIGLNNIASVLHDVGDLEGARTCLERALEIDEAVHGPDHLATGVRVNNLGNILQDLGDLAEARPCYERALLIFRGQLGETHPRTEEVRNALRALEVRIRNSLQ